MLQLHQLTIGHGRTALTTPLTATLAVGALTALVGRNGCGKSTLLRTMAGLHAPLGGEVRVNQQRVADLSAQQRARHFALVLADRAQPPLLTVGEVVALGRRPYTSWLGGLQPTDHAAVEEAMQQCGVLSLAHRSLSTLSDGERQRVMIARALAQVTPMIFLDEPTAFLDFPAKVETLILLHRIARSQQKLILLSTHDLELTFQLADRLWVLHEKQLYEGTPQHLADAGVVERAFASEALTFDPHTLRFSRPSFSTVPLDAAPSSPLSHPSPLNL